MISFNKLSWENSLDRSDREAGQWTKEEFTNEWHFEGNNVIVKMEDYSLILKFRVKDEGEEPSNRSSGKYWFIGGINKGMPPFV